MRGKEDSSSLSDINFLFFDLVPNVYFLVLVMKLFFKKEEVKHLLFGNKSRSSWILSNSSSANGKQKFKRFVFRQEKTITQLK